MITIHKILLSLILIVGVIVRIPTLSTPVLDWHSHRQSDTLAVTIRYLSNGIDVLKPKYFDLSNVQSGQENPQGYRLVEFPFYNLISVLLSQFVTPVIASRSLSLLFFIASSFLVFKITQKLTSNNWAGIFSTFIYTFLPYNIFYSRAILPEPMAVFFMLLTLYTFSTNLFLSSVFFAIAILLKPYVALIIFPYLFFTSLINLKSNFKSSFPKLLFFSIISLLPFILWRLYINQIPEGIPYSKWLFNYSDQPIFPQWFHGINLTWVNHMVAFRPYWFEWLFFHRPILIFGPLLSIPFFLGFAYKYKHHLATNVTLSLGIIIYYIIVAGGNIRHDYYQYLIVPTASIIIGQGLYYLIRFLKLPLLFTSFSVFVIIAFSFFISFGQIKSFFATNHMEYLEASEYINNNLETDSIIVSPNNGDSTFINTTKHPGYPTEIYDFQTIKNYFNSQSIYLVLFNHDDYYQKNIRLFPKVYSTNNFDILKVQ